MAVGTLTVKIDLANSGSPSDNITAYVQGPMTINGVGVAGGGDLAGPSRISLTVDNRDGRFTPRNTGSPYYPDFRPGIQILVEAVFNSLTYGLFSGYISEITVLPEPARQQVRIVAVDPFLVLAAQEVRLPLMVEQQTGVIISRLVDYAEPGELAENDRFLVDLTGWSIAVGTGTLTRTTAPGVPLHLPAAMLVENLSQPSGEVRYVLPDNHAGESCIITAYVRAKTLADEGKLLRVYLKDDAGTTTAGAPQALSARTWTRLRVSGTYNAGATECRASIVRVSGTYAANFVVGALHVIRTSSEVNRGVSVNQIDAGVGLIDYVAYTRSVAALTAIQDICRNELGGLFFANPTGVCYHDRAHRWDTASSVTPQATFTERLDLEYTELLDDRLSLVRFYYASPDVGAAGSIIYTMNPVPVMIPASGELTFNLDFGGALIRDMVRPVANTDYTVNANANGTGVDDSGDVTLTFLDFGAGASVTLHNTKTRATWLTLFRVRGTPVRMPTDQYVEITPTNDLPLNNELVYTYNLQAREAHIRPWAEHIAAKYGDVQTPRIRATAGAPWPQSPTSGTDIASVLDLAVGDRITITNTALPFSSKLSGDYYIDGLSRRFTDTEVSLTMDLVAVDDDYFTIDTDAVNGAKVLAP